MKEPIDIFEAPDAPGLENRQPTEEEIPEAVWAEEAEPAPFQASGEAVDMLDSLIQEMGEPQLATWERALLVWSLDGLDISAAQIPQPQRALAGCGVVGFSRIYTRRKNRRPQPPADLKVAPAADLSDIQPPPPVAEDADPTD